ncbi:MAG: hypothetical protein V3U08_04420, partial [Nitrospirales bacterium]
TRPTAIFTFLLHPPDLMDEQDAPSLGYLPGMATPWRKKVELVKAVIGELRESRTPTTLAGVVDQLRGSNLRLRRFGGLG